MSQSGMAEFWGEPISVYTRDQAIEDGFIVDVTEWASADKGFIGGFTCPVAMTRALWDKVQAPKRSRFQDTRGRAHDVLWLCSLVCKRALRIHPGTPALNFKVLVGGRYLHLRCTMDGDGVTIGFREDF